MTQWAECGRIIVPDGTSRIMIMYCTSESCGSIGVGAQCINNICLNGTCHAARLDTAVKEHTNTVHAC
jgi:hypothetical protein